MGNTCSTNSPTTVVPVEVIRSSPSVPASYSAPRGSPSNTASSPTHDGPGNGSGFYHEPNSAFRDGASRKSPLLLSQSSQSPTKMVENNSKDTPLVTSVSSVAKGSATSGSSKDSGNPPTIHMTSFDKARNASSSSHNDEPEIPTMASMRASSILRSTENQISPSVRPSQGGEPHSSVEDANIDQDTIHNHNEGPTLFSSEYMTGRLSSLTNTPVSTNNNNSTSDTTTTTTTGKHESAKLAKKKSSATTGHSSSQADGSMFTIPPIPTDSSAKKLPLATPEDLKAYVDIVDRDSSTATIINESGNQGLNSTIGSPAEAISPNSVTSAFSPGSVVSSSTGGNAVSKDGNTTNKTLTPLRRASQFAPLPLRKGESVKFIVNKPKSTTNEQAPSSDLGSSPPRRSPLSSPVDDFECEFVEDIHDRYIMDPVPLGKGSFGEVLLTWRILPRLDNETEDNWKARCKKGSAIALKRVQPAPERLSAAWKHKLPPKPTATTNHPSSTGTANPSSAPDSSTTHNKDGKGNRVVIPSSTLVRDASSVHSEARILYRVRNCDYVVRLMDYCVDNSHVYIGMEHCGGGDLMKFVLQCRNFSERVAAYLFKQMLLGVSHCHSVGVVHRDLKPDNFLFANAEGKAHLKICDFGLATIVSSREKLMQDAVGSAFFIAPEVFTRNYTLACDAWSLGINLYLLLSGTVPFGATATRAVDVHRSIQNDPLTFHGKTWANISTSAKELVSGLLDKHPHRRYTVEQALQHPWVSGDAAPDAPLDSHVVQNMVKWVNQNRLRKEAVKLVATTLTAADVRKLREQFHAIDTNSDLAISPSELATALTNLGANLGNNTLSIDQLVKAMDTDGDGVINLDEFLAATAELQMVAHQTQMWWAFCQYDRNGDGLIDLNEAKAVLGDTEDFNTVAEQIAQYDTDGDGRINYEEFLKMLVPEGFHFNTLHFVDEEALIDD